MISKIEFDKKTQDYKYIVKFNDNRTTECFRQNIQALDESDVGSLPSSLADYKTACSHLNENEIEQIKSPVSLKPLQME